VSLSLNGKIMKPKRIKEFLQMPWKLLVILAFDGIANSTTVFSINVLSAEKRQRSVPSNLKVNFRTMPLGIDSHPAFGWDSKVTGQTAYQIQVATSISDIKVGKFILNSNKVKQQLTIK
jgi:hypothetical protein